MQKVARWKDGFSLQRDPRGEDSLYYYLRADDWSRAIGLQLLPLWEERSSERVELVVFKDDKALFRELSTAERNELLVRVIPAIAAKYANWRRLIVRIEGVERVRENEALAESMQRLGFDRVTQEGADRVEWSRSEPFRRPGFFRRIFRTTVLV